MKRFVIRNYGASRQIPYKGQSISIANDGIIETDDEKEAAALKDYEAITVTDRGGGSELAPSSSEKSPEDSVDKPEEVSYESMKLPELQAIAKDREISTTDKKKPKLIAELKAYDETPDAPPSDETPWEVNDEVSVEFEDGDYKGVISSIDLQKETVEVEFEDDTTETVPFKDLISVEKEEVKETAEELIA